METRIANGILNNRTTEEVSTALNRLAAIFHEEIRSIVPKDIREAASLEVLLDMADKLTALESCRGFYEHVRTYKANVQSAYFTTCVAAVLVGSVADLVLEPCIPNSTRVADIKFSVGVSDVYVECKSPLYKRKWAHESRLTEVCNLLLPYINVPHQITVVYDDPLTDEEVRELGRSLAQTLPAVKSKGTVIETSRYRVHVDVRHEFGPIYVNLSCPMTYYNEYVHTTYLCRWFLTQGKNISIAGPKIDCEPHLRKAITSGRKQGAVNASFILALNTDGLVGSLVENIRAVQQIFSPRANTRYSGVLLMSTASREESSRSLPKAVRPHFVSNPFARFPLDDRTGGLFRW